ncbi:MAG: carboxypeptidase regulatory-like domain-containing protein [Flavobacteriaceae bacterium]
MKNYRILTLLFVLIAAWGCSEDTVDAPKIGAISGAVIDKETGDPLENVKITTNPASSTVFTNENGNFFLPEVIEDDYSVQADLETYSTGFESVSVIEGITSNVAFELELADLINTPPTTPELIFPENGANEVLLEVEFSWSASDTNGDELNYTLDVRNGITNEILLFEVGQDTALVVSDLQLATNYFWQVTVTDDVNEPVSSPISEFTTFTSPDNPIIIVKKIDGNNVLFSGNEDVDPEGEPDFNLLQLTSESTNSFRPRRNLIVNKLAFLRTVGGDVQIFTMNLDGTDVNQVTSNIPVAGFRHNELDFTWANNGQLLYYANFDKLYSIDPDGGGATLLYQTADGLLISEIDMADFDSDLVLLKTNNVYGYEARIYTLRLSSGVEETIIHEGESGAVGGVSFSANADKVLFTKDLSGSQNNSYRQFEARIFLYDIPSATLTEIISDVALGENDLDVSFSPSEGGAIFTRVGTNEGAIPVIAKLDFDQGIDDKILFNNAFMPDWQ